MKPLGIVRQLDPLGRICIPREFRRTHGWDDRTPIEMFAADDSLVLRKYEGRDGKKAEIAKTIMWAVEELGKDNSQKEEISKRLKGLIPQFLE